MPSRLATSLCGVALKTPVLAASGTYAYGVELKDLRGLGSQTPTRPSGVVGGGIVADGLDVVHGAGRRKGFGGPSLKARRCPRQPSFPIANLNFVFGLGF